MTLFVASILMYSFLGFNANIQEDNKKRLISFSRTTNCIRVFECDVNTSCFGRHFDTIPDGLDKRQTKTSPTLFSCFPVVTLARLLAQCQRSLITPACIPAQVRGFRRKQFNTHCVILPVARWEQLSSLVRVYLFPDLRRNPRREDIVFRLCAYNCIGITPS